MFNSGLDTSAILFGFAGIAVLAHMLWVFTRRLGGEMKGDEAIQPEVFAGRIRAIVIYGYVSILAVLGLAIIPFVDSDFPNIYPSSKAPIHIVKACPGVSEDPQNAGRLSCRPDRVQWVLNVGGVAEDRIQSGDDTPHKEAKEVWLKVIRAAETKALAEIQEDTSLPSDQRTLIANEAVKGIQNVSSKFPLQTPLDGSVISGGLVIPLYMIIIALIGGCIGMTRRLPEYQTRGAPGYADFYEANKATNTSLKPPLVGVQVREYVIFQILQALFAPFLAVVAYVLLDPTDIAGIVVIGFIAGFAAEPLLLQIRKIAEASVGKLSVGQTGAAVKVPNPKPQAKKLDRAEVLENSDDLSFVITGENFAKDAEVHVDGEARETEVLRDGKRAVFDLLPKDVAEADKELKIKIVNPAPGGGASDQLPLKVK